MKLLRILHAERPTPPHKHTVQLRDADRRALRRLLTTGTAPARTLPHARILLKAGASAAGPAWTANRNTAIVSVQWHFTPTGARTRLKRRYPLCERWRCMRRLRARTK